VAYDYRDLTIEHLTAEVYDLKAHNASMRDDLEISQQLVRESISMLHDAQKRDTRQRATIAELIAEVRRLRPQQDNHRRAA
jgi:hypothetical protein